MFKDPKTTIGGLIALATVVGLLAHQLDLTAAITLLGIAATWIGISGKDSGRPTPPPAVTEEKP